MPFKFADYKWTICFVCLACPPSYPLSLRLTFQRQLHSHRFKKVNGLAHLDGILYTICEKSSAIHVFPSCDQEQVKLFAVEGMRRPKDIVACDRNKCLYIADDKLSCVFKIDVCQLQNGLTEHLSPTIVFEVKDPFTMSIAHNGRLLLSRYHTNKLVLREGDGSFTKPVLLPNDVKAVHAIQISDGKILVAYKKLVGTNKDIYELSDPSNWFVGEFDEDGTQLFCSDPQAGNLLYNRYLTLVGEGDDKAIVIADCDNSAIVQLDRSLSLGNILLNKELDSIANPRRIIYLNESKQLVVGLQNGWINIYGVAILRHTITEPQTYQTL